LREKCSKNNVISPFARKRNAPVSAIYQYMMGGSIEECEKCSQKWNDRLKTVSKPRVSTLTGREE
jgi:hypothetical protein